MSFGALQTAILNFTHSAVFGSVMLCVLVIFLALLTFGVCMARLNQRRKFKEVVPVISPDVSRRHMALIWLIRCGEALFIVPLLLLILLIGCGALLSINPFRQPSTGGLVFSVIMMVAFLLVCAGILSKLLRRLPISPHEIFEKLQRVDANSVSNFAFVFAAFAAHDVYALMPPKSPISTHDGSPLLTLFLDRNILWMIVFWSLWGGLKALLRRVLELKPRYQVPIDPDVPATSLPA